MKIYLDTSVYNRPFDDQTQPRTRLAAYHQTLNETIYLRAAILEKSSFQPIDALHIASAEQSGCDVLLTCDDKVIKRYSEKDLKILNPVNFVLLLTGE